MLTKEELTLLNLAGYERCNCISEIHWRRKNGPGTVNNPKLYESDLKRFLYGE